MGMYNIPKDPDSPTIVTKEETDIEKRIDMLEHKISRIAEQMNRLSEFTQQNSRAVKRQNTDITNLTTAIRKR